jgi:hypothetical protein
MAPAFTMAGRDVPGAVYRGAVIDPHICRGGAAAK